MALERCLLRLLDERDPEAGNHVAVGVERDRDAGVSEPPSEELLQNMLALPPSDHAELAEILGAKAL